MAETVGLSLKISASTAGLKSGLSDADRLLAKFSGTLKGLDQEFGKISAAAGGVPKSIASITEEMQALGHAMAHDLIDQQEFTNEFERLREEAKGLAQAFREGEAVTRQMVTEEERLSDELERLTKLLDVGAISQQTFDRATEKTTSQLNALRGPAKDVALSFNELSGAISLLPGPLGSIAGRMSGAYSAFQGLQKVVGGGAGVTVLMHELGGSLLSMVNPMTIVAAGAAAAAYSMLELGKALVAMEEYVERLDRSARQLGVSFEFMQALEESAHRTGGSIDSLGVAFTKFLRTRDSAVQGNDAAVEAFHRLGVSLDELEGMSYEDGIVRVGEALNGIEDPATKAALAVQLFGRQGMSMLDMFDQLEDSAKDVKRLNAELSDIDKHNFGKLGDAFDEVKVAMSGLGRNLATPFIGMFEQLSQGFATFVAGLSRVFGGAGDILSPFLTGVGAVIGGTLESLGTALNALGAILDVIATPFLAFNQVLIEAGRGMNEVFDYVNSLLAPFEALGGYVKAVAEWFGADFDIPAPQVEPDEIEAATIALVDFSDEIAKAQQASLEFGSAGFEAAVRYQSALQEINDLVAEGEYSEEQAARAAAMATAEFEAQIDAMEELLDLEQERLDAARKLIEEDQKRIDRLRDQMTIDTDFGGSSQRFEASQNLEAIDRERLRLEQELQAAREAGDQAAANAAAARLAELDQIRQREDDIASGRADSEKELSEKRKKLLEDEMKYMEQLAEIENARIDALSGVNADPLQAVDANSQAGMELAYRIANGTDPAIEAYEKQYSKLEEIRREIREQKIAIGEIGG